MKRRVLQQSAAAAAAATGAAPAAESAPPAVKKRARRTAGSSSSPSVAAEQQQQQDYPEQLVRGGWTELGEECRVGYWPAMLPPALASRAMQTLLDDVTWLQRDLRIFGRAIPQPRLVAYMADPDLPTYKYSGLTLETTPWSEMVLEIKAAVEALQPGVAYNSCLLNQYRGGGDYVSWHSDDEPLYGRHPVIASVSLGAPRDFILRRKGQHSAKIATSLSAGDVLLMAGATQEVWQHTVPKRQGAAAAATPARINLTFRRIVMPGSGGGDG